MQLLHQLIVLSNCPELIFSFFNAQMCTITQLFQGGYKIYLINNIFKGRYYKWTALLWFFSVYAFNKISTMRFKIDFHNNCTIEFYNKVVDYSVTSSTWLFFFYYALL